MAVTWDEEAELVVNTASFLRGEIAQEEAHRRDARQDLFHGFELQEHTHKILESNNLSSLQDTIKVFDFLALAKSLIASCNDERSLDSRILCACSCNSKPWKSVFSCLSSMHLLLRDFPSKEACGGDPGSASSSHVTTILIPRHPHLRHGSSIGAWWLLLGVGVAAGRGRREGEIVTNHLDGLHYRSLIHHFGLLSHIWYPFTCNLKKVSWSKCR